MCSVQVNFKASRDLRDAIKDKAAEDGITINNWLENAVKYKLGMPIEQRVMSGLPKVKLYKDDKLIGTAPLIIDSLPMDLDIDSEKEGMIYHAIGEAMRSGRKQVEVYNSLWKWKLSYD
jgi:hypothetical protein